MSHLSRTRAALAAATATLACAAPAAAQVATPPPVVPNSITVTGTGTVKPAPANRTSNAAIVAAVEKAEDAATPLALAEGHRRAVKLAELSGMRLGALLAIAETSQSPNGFFAGPFGPIGGSFGPGKYCGTVRRSVFRTTKDGKRKRVGTRTSRVCRIPPQVSASLAMTFTATPIPPG